jgi:hypothetical protein
LPNNRYEGIAGGVTIDTIKKSGTAQTPDFQIKEQSSFTVLFSLPFGK